MYRLQNVLKFMKFCIYRKQDSNSVFLDFYIFFCNSDRSFYFYKTCGFYFYCLPLFYTIQILNVNGFIPFYQGKRIIKNIFIKVGAREWDTGQKDFFWGCRESGIIIVSIPQKTSSALLRVFDPWFTTGSQLIEKSLYNYIAFIYYLGYIYLLTLKYLQRIRCFVVENVYVGKRHKSVLHYQTGFHRI